VKVNVHAAKTQLSKLLDLVEDGEEVVIQRHGKPVARLVAARKPRKFPFGAMRGEFSCKDGWEKAMTDEEVDAFLDGRW